MKYKLLSVGKAAVAKVVNIGDYIQALASSQYYPHIDGFLDRDTDLKDYDDESCKIIMNGWYMHEPQNWPPSEKIIPLFVAFHINVLAKKEMTSSESISYLKAHEPIGCRDIGTMSLLKKNGVNAYFSGCMTLTLGKKYYSKEKNDKTYIVDPLIYSISLKDVPLAICHFLKFPCDIVKLLRNKGLRVHPGKSKLKEFVKTALYHKEYSDLLSRSIVMNSVYVCQQSRYYKENFPAEGERLLEAEKLIRQYARAKMVITSRIHCALPCLGLETPVLFIRKTNDTIESSCRFDGLEDLFNVINVDDKKQTLAFTADLSNGEIPINKTLWKNLAESLDKRCSSFITE